LLNGNSIQPGKIFMETMLSLLVPCFEYLYYRVQDQSYRKSHGIDTGPILISKVVSLCLGISSRRVAASVIIADFNCKSLRV
jgi:hypothetical protein